jgi:hypothetical protein
MTDALLRLDAHFRKHFLRKLESIQPSGHAAIHGLLQECLTNLGFRDAIVDCATNMGL